MDKTIRRTPDGKPEKRTPDEMLRDAVSDDIDIPGKGEPLDLKTYFRPDAEHRMAGKILRDNNVLPAHLQERKTQKNTSKSRRASATDNRKKSRHCKKQFFPSRKHSSAHFPTTKKCAKHSA